MYYLFFLLAASLTLLPHFEHYLKTLRDNTDTSSFYRDLKAIMSLDCHRFRTRRGTVDRSPVKTFGRRIGPVRYNPALHNPARHIPDQLTAHTVTNSFQGHRLRLLAFVMFQ